MNLTARFNRSRISKYVLASLLLSFFPSAFGPIQSAVAAPATTLSSNTTEALCASTASDTSSARLDVILDGNYCVLRFLSSTNTWTPPRHLTSFRFLAIGGGGAGGWGRGGGGGAGGFLDSTTSVTQTSYSISIGSGGVATSTSAPNGGNTSIGSIQVGGGGGGGGHNPGAGISATEPETPNVVNGSGGGAGMNYSTLQPRGEIVTISLVGLLANNGAGPACSTDSTCAEPVRNTGGGGGAGRAGYSGRDGNNRGGWDSATATLTQVGDRPDGGEGASSTITGRSVTYAGGGGGSVGIADSEFGGGYRSASFGRGKAGGGNGSYPVNTTTITPGGSALANTGSGGGGGSGTGGNGGSGIVIVRFQVPPFTNNSAECISGITNTSANVLEYSIVAGDCLLVFSTPDSVTAGTNSWTVPLGVETVSAVLVGGGGGGGSKLGGGGGGGQVVDSTTVPLILTPGTTYSLSIGNGGATRGVISTYSAGGTNGGATSITSSGFSVRALGGGGAAGDYQSAFSYADNTGWSTGGEGMQLNWSSGVSITSVNANNFPVGGASFKGGMGGRTSGTWGGGGGGGGAGGAGGNAFYNSSTDQGAGNGAPGVTTSILGFARCFGGGGGGGADQSAGGTALSTATCGGAGGARNSSVVNHATPDTGGGGGGGGTFVSTNNGGRGGTGLIILRFDLPNPTGATQNLNMACHWFSSATDVPASISAGFYGSRFTTDSTTTEFSFPASTETGTTMEQDWRDGNPTGCGNNGDNFTLYMWGYIRAPNESSSESLTIATISDMGIRYKIDGVDHTSPAVWADYENVGSFQSQRMSFYTNFTWAPRSWHFVEFWAHERDPTTSRTGNLRANFSINWRLSNGSVVPIPRQYVSKSVPRTISTSLATNSQSSTPTLTASVDTNSTVIGGVNDSTTAMSMGGKFSFFENGQPLTGCQNVNSSNGTATCAISTVPDSIPRRYFRVEFIPDSSTAFTDTQYNVFATTIWDGVILSGRVPNAKLRIGQYLAFIGVSSYPLNVYGDGPIYGAITRTLTDSGTANCVLDATRYFLTASRVGSCTVAVNAAGDSLRLPETATATIYWFQWSDAYATRAPSSPTEIVLNHSTAITKYNYDTLTVTSYQNSSGVTITSIATGATLRIIGDGFSPTAAYTEVVFASMDYVDLTSGLQVVSSGGSNYLQLTVPSGVTSGAITVNSPKGTAFGPVLTITP